MISFLLETVNNTIYPLTINDLKKLNGQFVKVKDDNFRILTINEMDNPLKYLKVDLVKRGYIPLINCYDNVFLVYQKNISKYHLIDLDDCIPFETYNSLKEFWGMYT